MSPCIMGLTTPDPYILKEHTEHYKILKFRVSWANIEQDTAIQKLKNLLTNVRCITSIEFRERMKTPLTVSKISDLVSEM